MAPSTQKAGFRPISFTLDDGQGNLTTVSLNIRPEDLTKTDPSRVTVQQTLGNSAFVDNFGPGLASIVISGHTGWRGNFTGDGAAIFQQLKDTVFGQWHDARDQARQSGLDPDSVRLIFTDDLDDFAVVVVPRQFLLKRSRIRPLLMMYQISMTVVDDLGNAIAGDLEDDIGDPDQGAALESLQDNFDDLDEIDLSDVIDGTLLDPCSAFLATATAALGQTLDVLQGGVATLTDADYDLLSLTADLCLSGRLVFGSVSSILAPTDYGVISTLASVASTFDNAMCVLLNAFSLPKNFPDYSGIYGASTCSSTTGGSPPSQLRDENAFEAILPSAPPMVAVSVPAQSAIDTLKLVDPVLLPPTQDELVPLLLAVSAGVSFQ